MSQESIPVPDARTIAAYESTRYFAHEAKPVLVRIGDPASSHQAWLEKMGAKSATIMTAWNPLGEEKSPAENDLAQAALRAAIEDAGAALAAGVRRGSGGGLAAGAGFLRLRHARRRSLDDWLARFRQNAAVQFTRKGRCRLVWHPSIRPALERLMTLNRVPARPDDGRQAGGHNGCCIFRFDRQRGGTKP